METLEPPDPATTSDASSHAPSEPSLAEQPAAAHPGAPLRFAMVAEAAPEHAPVPLRPGQLSPGWRMAFISGWVGVLAGYGALWQAGRIAGIAPWWLGPETDLRPIYVIALPYIAPLVVIVCAFVGVRASCYIGIVASLACGAIALGDLHFPGLAVVDTLIGVFALMISGACLGGRMRPLADPGTAEATVEPVAPVAG